MPQRPRPPVPNVASFIGDLNYDIARSTRAGETDEVLVHRLHTLLDLTLAQIAVIDHFIETAYLLGVNEGRDRQRLNED